MPPHYPNMNLKTNIHFGYISANDLDGDLVHELLYGRQAHCNDILESPPEEEYYPPEEPDISGVYEGVTYRTSWLGGALHFFITDAKTCGYYHKCSPCVPNAGNLSPHCHDPELDSPHLSVLTYEVPTEWRQTYKLGV